MEGTIPMDEEKKGPNQKHAWKGAWNRPMKLDEDSLHPFTVARMTDHNVRGNDEPDDNEKTSEQSKEENARAAKSDASDLKEKLRDRDHKKSA